jgi:heat shock protein HtpX
MVDALRRLEDDRTPLTRFESANAHLWFEEPNDLEGAGRPAHLARRFATHPTLEQRIARLAQLNAGTVDPTRPLRPVDRRTPPPAPPSSPPPAAPPAGPPAGPPTGPRRG